MISRPAAFFIVAASIRAGSALEITNVGVNETRTGLIDILRAMGARASTSGNLAR